MSNNSTKVKFVKLNLSKKQAASLVCLLLLASLCGCGRPNSNLDSAGMRPNGAVHASINPRPLPLRKVGYTYACWLNGWRKNNSDTNQAVLAIQTSGYDFSLNPSDFSRCGFALERQPAAGYAEALHSGAERLQSLPPAQIIIELDENGQTYRAMSCQAGNGKDARRLSSARLWESGRFVQHYDFSGLKFEDAAGRLLNCSGTLDLVAWPDSLTITASLTPGSFEGTHAKLRLRLAGSGLDCQTENPLSAQPAPDAEDSVTVTYQTPLSPSPSADISLQVSAGAGQMFPVAFAAGKNCFVASVRKINRSFKAGYTDIRDYDEFSIVVENNGNAEKEVPFLLDFRNPANITGLCPMLCDAARPTGIPVQLSKNWHNGQMGEYLMAYSSLPAKPGRNEYRLRVVYGFYGTLPSASHAQLCLVGYREHGGNGRWDQLAIGCWGETFCLDMDMSLVDVAITDVRMLMARDGLNGTKWGWTDAGWGGDWLGMWNANGEKLAFNDLKAAYLSQGPCLTDVRYDGDYGAGHEVSLTAQVRTLRTDDNARTFLDLKYIFHTAAQTSRLWLFKMGGTGSYLTPQIAYGNRAGLIADQPVPGNLKPDQDFVDHLSLKGQGPWWVAFPGARFNNGSNWGTGYRALVIRSYKATIGGKIFTSPTISMPVNKVQQDGSGLDLHLLLIVPKTVPELRPGDSVEMSLEWITLPRNADDYYGPNETFRKHLAENPSSWKTTYREAIGNDLAVTVNGGAVLNRYPIVIHADAPTVTVNLKGGVGFVPIQFTGLKSVKDPALYEVVAGKKVKFDQSVHGNDFWQTDYDAETQTYELTFNLPLDNQPESKWILQSEGE